MGNVLHLVSPKFSVFASYLTPLSCPERDAMASDSLELNISNSSTHNLKLLPVTRFDSLFRRKESSYDTLILPIGALKFYPLPFLTLPVSLRVRFLQYPSLSWLQSSVL